VVVLDVFGSCNTDVIDVEEIVAEEVVPLVVEFLPMKRNNDLFAFFGFGTARAIVIADPVVTIEVEDVVSVERLSGCVESSSIDG
jgi:hypothetical protein